MENLKNKFNNWEPTPPLNAWANISDALDKDEEYILLQKMTQYSANHPYQYGKVLPKN